MLTGPPDSACYQLHLCSESRSRRQVRRESHRRGKIEDAGHIPLYACASVCVRAHVVMYVRGCVAGGRCWPQPLFPVATALFLEAGSLAEPGAH